MKSSQQTHREKKDKNKFNPKNSPTPSSHKTPKKETEPLSLPNQESEHLLRSLGQHEPSGESRNLSGRAGESELPKLTQEDKKLLLEGFEKMELSSNSIAEQATFSSRAEKNDSPNRVGIEQELGSVNLTFSKYGSKTDEKKGVKLAETDEQTFDLPVLKLETEGDDKPLYIELIYGPLEMEEYNNKAFKGAKEKLLAELKKKQDLKDALSSYNGSLKKEEKRYRLKVFDVAKKYKIAKGNKIATSTQTNVSIPYSKLGQTPQKGETGFEEMFGPKDNQGRSLYMKAREEAKMITSEIIKEQKVTIPNDKHLQSLLTHIIFEEARFITHDINKDSIEPKDKYNFNVLIKLSPQDAIVSTLSEQENEALSKWLKEQGKEENQKKKLEKSIKNTLKSLHSGRKLNVNITEIKDQLKPATDARSKGAKKLGRVEKDNDKSKVFDESDNVMVDEEGIRHTHPRPTNRIPVYSHGDEHYMVVEQRSAKHMLNQDDVKDSFSAKSKLIAGLSKVS